MWLTKHNILSVLLILSSVLAFGQSKSELEKQKKQLLNDIDITNKLLNQTEANKKTGEQIQAKTNGRTKTRRNKNRRNKTQAKQTLSNNNTYPTFTFQFQFVRETGR